MKSPIGVHQISDFTWVYGRYIELVHGVHKPTYTSKTNIIFGNIPVFHLKYGKKQEKPTNPKETYVKATRIKCTCGV